MECRPYLAEKVKSNNFSMPALMTVLMIVGGVLGVIKINRDTFAIQEDFNRRNFKPMISYYQDHPDYPKINAVKVLK